MTYPFKLKVEVRMRVYILKKIDKAKANKDPYICKKILINDKKEIVIENFSCHGEIKAVLTDFKRNYQR